MTPTNSPAAVRGEAARRRGLIPAQCWRAAWNDALITAGVLACLAALYGLAVLTRPLGVLLFALSHGGH